MPRRPEDILASPWRFFLLPGWMIYRPLIALRNRIYDFGWRPVFHLNVPVISVGNLAAGGTGKTPICAWIASWLREQGRTPAVLMRGYGGDGGPNDEARTLSVPVVCNPDRLAGGHQAIAAGADCLILDDGFQHRRLHRDCDLVAIDALRPWGGGAVIPLGLLREGRAGLRRAHGFLITRSDQIPDEDLERLRTSLARWGKPVLCTRHQPHGLLGLDGGEPFALDHLRGREVILVSGLGNPAGFEHTAQQLDWRVAQHMRYPDHHPYSQADLKDIIALRDRHAATVVMTTKDAVKLRNRGLDGALVLEVVLGFAEGDAERLSSLLAATLNPAPPSSEPTTSGYKS